MHHISAGTSKRQAVSRDGSTEGRFAARVNLHATRPDAPSGGIGVVDDPPRQLDVAFGHDEALAHGAGPGTVGVEDVGGDAGVGEDRLKEGKTNRIRGRGDFNHAPGLGQMDVFAPGGRSRRKGGGAFAQNGREQQSRHPVVAGQAIAPVLIEGRRAAQHLGCYDLQLGLDVEVYEDLEFGAVAARKGGEESLISFALNHGASPFAGTPQPTHIR